VTLLYADTSAVVRAYFADEQDHATLRKLLLSGPDPVVTSELTRVEFASAVTAATRAPRLGPSTRPHDRAGPPTPIAVPAQTRSRLLHRFDLDCGTNGPFTLLRLDSAEVLPVARRLVTHQQVRTLDALHIAVALTDAAALAAGEPVVLVTRDKQQAAAAQAVGLSVL
jgi:predicted nucleic acid-binding protein